MTRLILLLFSVLFFAGCGTKTSSDEGKKNTNGQKEQSLSPISKEWVKYSFTDSEVSQFPDIVEQSLVDFIAQFPTYTKEDLNVSLRNLISRSESSPLFFSFLKEKISSYLYDPNSPMRNDTYYEVVLDAYQSSKLLSEADKARDLIILDLVRKNQVGDKSADFAFIDGNGKKHEMSSIKASKKLLVFYDPLCVHCNEIITQMKESKILNDAIVSNKVVVLAVDPIGNIEAWKEYNKNIPKSWINGFDQSGVIRSLPLYNLLAFPTIYLLDNNDEVLMKDVYFEVVENYFYRNIEN